MSKQRVLVLFRRACTLAGLALVAAVGVYAAPQGPAYKVIRRMPVGGEGGWDYLRVDPDAHRIYAARGTHLMVVDDVSGKVIADIPASNTRNMHGIALAKDLGKGFTSNGDANTVTVIDLKTLKALKVIPISGKDPDSILYDPMTKRIFTFNGRSANSTVIDATTEKEIGTVALAGKPEEPALDGQGNVFVNIEDKSMLQKFDATTLVVKGTWPLAPCEEPSALAFDSAHHRLFSVCDKVMVVVNSDTGKVVASPAIAGDPDGDGFDPATGLVFASCREGVVTVLHQDSPDKYSFVGNVKTMYGARTMTINLKTHHVYTESAKFTPAPPKTAANPRPRPQAVPGSYVIMELGQ